MTTTTNTQLPLVPGRWALDTNHSSVGFSIRHLGVSKVRGRFMRFHVDVVIGAAPPWRSARRTSPAPAATRSSTVTPRSGP